MSDQHITVSVRKDLEDLIPEYLANRTTELATLRTLLAVGDFEQISMLGNRMKGVGEPYGFYKVTVLGKLIQDGARTGDHRILERCIHEYADYLQRVHIVYE